MGLFVDRSRPAYDQTVRPGDLEEIREVLAQHGEQIACLVVEQVVQGAGGMWFYAPDHLRQLGALCREHGLLVLFDEIATGFGRTGQLFGAEHADVTPDIMCLGKALTGGYLSLGATLCTQQVADGICAPAGNALMHGPTFMANPLACSVALASTRLLLTEPWLDRIAAISTSLRQQLEPCRDLPGVADVRVLGAGGVVEWTSPSIWLSSNRPSSTGASGRARSARSLTRCRVHQRRRRGERDHRRHQSAILIAS